MGNYARYNVPSAGDDITAADYNGELNAIAAILNGFIEAVNLAADAVETPKIKNAAVTLAKLAADSVDKDKIAADVAGSGLGQNGDGSLEVNVDDSTIEISTDTLRVKDGGITDAKIASANPVAFSVHKDGTGQTLTTGLSTKVTWAAEVFDTNSDFDIATNERFTPSVAGKYLLTATITFEGDGSLFNVQVYIAKNGTGDKGAQNIIGGIAPLKYGSVSFSCVFDANGSSDYFEVFARQDSGGNLDILGNATYTHFSGHRIAFS